VNAEVDVLDDVRFDGVAVAGHGNTGGLFGHLTPAVADDKTAQHDAVAVDRDDTSLPEPVDDRVVAPDHDHRTVYDNGSWIDPLANDQRATGRRRIDPLLKRHLGASVGRVTGEQ